MSSIKEVISSFKVSPVLSEDFEVMPRFDFNIKEGVLPAFPEKVSDYEFNTSRFSKDEIIADGYLLCKYAKGALIQYRGVLSDDSGDTSGAITFGTDRGVNATFKSGFVPSIDKINARYDLECIEICEGYAIKLKSALKLIKRDYKGKVFIGSWGNYSEGDDCTEAYGSYSFASVHSIVVVPYDAMYAKAFIELLSGGYHCLVLDTDDKKFGKDNFIENALEFINDSSGYYGDSDSFNLEGSYNHFDNEELIDLVSYKRDMEEGWDRSYNDAQLLALFNEDPIAETTWDRDEGNVHTAEFLALK